MKILKLSLAVSVVGAALALTLPAAAQTTVGGVPIGHLPALGDPNLTGKWINTTPMAALKTSDGKAPPLNAKGRAAYAKNKANPKADNINLCQVHGIPRLMFTSYPFLILQYDQHIDFVHEVNRTYRIVYFSDKLKREGKVDVAAKFGEKIDPEIDPIWMGHNNAKIAGKSVVIESINFNNKTWLDYTGLPHGDQLKVRETYTLSDDGQTINATAYIEDPEFFTRPWTTAFTLRKEPGFRLREFVCLDDHRM